VGLPDHGQPDLWRWDGVAVTGAPLRYVGVDRRGIGRTGMTTRQTAADLAVNLWAHRWKSAEITDGEGNIVGGVADRADGEGRHWWGER